MCVLPRLFCNGLENIKNLCGSAVGGASNVKDVIFDINRNRAVVSFASYDAAAQCLVLTGSRVGENNV